MNQQSDSAKIAVIESIVTRMEKRLFGADGTLGEMERFDVRLTKLENWRWWVVGIAIGVAVASGFGINKAMELFAK